MKKPLIGIVAKEKDIRFHGWSVNTISNELRAALIESGARVIGLLPPQKDRFATPFPKTGSLTVEETNDLNSLISLCDGIVLQGGTSSYRFEEEVVRQAIKLNKPFLGICAGLNTMVRAVGGRADLLPVPHAHYHPESDVVHDVILTPDSLLAEITKTTLLHVNSIHNNTVYDAGPYRQVGKTPDGLIEVVEMPHLKFHMGVHFHPELDIETNSASCRLFQAFVQAAATEK